MERRNIVILGGGTAGWMTAAALVKALPAAQYKIILVESDQIGTVGVGEATIPHIRQFNQTLGIDENAFIKAVGATYKLAIRFNGWGESDQGYFHPFGISGQDLNGISFHQFYLAMQQAGHDIGYDAYSIAGQMARAGKFRYPAVSGGPENEFGYAFHLDATLYAQMLSKLARQSGVERIEGLVEGCRHHANGDIDYLVLQCGRQISGDLFIDCSGFRARLIEQQMQAGFENWQHWLPCDSALAVASVADPQPPPFTTATAHQAGWQWRIPLQHRTGNGIVYASDYLSDEQAGTLLHTGLKEAATSEARKLSFVTGKRKRAWVGNCVAIGLSGGFLEPLESTSLYLVQVAIQKLITYFPVSPESDVAREAFNQHLDAEYERVRDFLILHYKLNRRQSSEFWQACQQMRLPESLQQRLDMFLESGHLVEYRNGLFLPSSWYALLLGQGVRPNKLDPRVTQLPVANIEQFCRQFHKTLQTAVQTMPDHRGFIDTLPKHAPYPKASFSLYGKSVVGGAA